MIAHLSGKILSKQPNQVVVEAGGVGYDVTIPISSFYDLGDEGATASLHIYTHVREESISLYGFRTRREKQIFEKLISVSGIGPKLGIAILSGINPDELILAIQQSDLAKLTRIPGVGRKTAERVALELRDKLAPLAAESVPREEEGGELAQIKQDVLSALVNLGYPSALADKAVREVLREAGRRHSFETVLRDSLQFLTR